jgi:hypothetical protein
MLEASPLGLLALLLMGHFVADFVLQHDRLAVEKGPGADVTLNWRWWLTSHAACHGLFVALLTGLPSLGMAEWAAHWLIDFAKCRWRLSLALDQALHALCKVLWVACWVNAPGA